MHCGIAAGGHSVICHSVYVSVFKCVAKCMAEDGHGKRLARLSKGLAGTCHTIQHSILFRLGCDITRALYGLLSKYMACYTQAVFK